jgi:hypothetical protein
MEYRSAGFYHYSITPILQYSMRMGVGAISLHWDVPIR